MLYNPYEKSIEELAERLKKDMIDAGMAGVEQKKSPFDTVHYYAAQILLGVFCAKALGLEPPFQPFTMVKPRGNCARPVACSLDGKIQVMDPGQVQEVRFDWCAKNECDKWLISLREHYSASDSIWFRAEDFVPV